MRIIFIFSIFILIIISGLCFNKPDAITHDIPVTPVKISCINMGYVKGMLVISSYLDYQEFLDKSSAAVIIGNACASYTAPEIDFSIYHLIVVHEDCGGCEEPAVTKSFYYNSFTDRYEYTLTLKQKGICKMSNHIFENFLVKRSDIDVSKINYMPKIIKPVPENR